MGTSLYRPPFVPASIATKLLSVASARAFLAFMSDASLLLSPSSRARLAMTAVLGDS